MKSLSFALGMMIVFTATQGSALAEDLGPIARLRAFVSRETDDLPVMTSARQIEASNLMHVGLKTAPWSSTYWPDMTGSVANPYGESGMRWPLSWGPNRSSLLGRPSLNGGSARISDADIAVLSPAEKYDLLMGDENFTFTRQVIKRIDQLHDIHLLKPLVALWSGICHGWSPASLTMPRPEHSFALTSPTGRAIPFYPADIKALESMAWGDAFGPGGAQNFVKVEGFQCHSGAHTDHYGRLTDPKCFDVNPGFFHLAAVNQLGLNQRGFVMDRDFRAEVQNQPVFAYDFKYYRIADGRSRAGHPGVSLDQARIAYTSRVWDPYRKYRSPRTVALVGVEARVWYGKENKSVQTDRDIPAYDKADSLVIRYDLELSDNDEIVGGEWREYEGAPTLFEQFSYKHPDIIWAVPPFVEPFSIGDWDIKETVWDGSGAVPAEWRQAAVRSALWSSNENVYGYQLQKLYPQPLLKVVKVLIEQSRK